VSNGQDWSAENSSPLTALLPVAAEEWRRRTVLLVGVFMGIALGALALGIVLPKKFASNTTILVEESNIIGPLMEGRAVTTDVVNRAIIAKEVAFSRRVMNEILKTGGWMAKNPTPVAQERLIEEITSRTQITNPRENLIQIEYVDTDPKRAYDVTRRFADMVISESLATKERESRDAYEFIDSQVSQYHTKLTEAEGKLEAYRTSNPDARPGIDTDVNARIGELRRQIETSRMDMIDLRSQEGAIRGQLSGEDEVSMVQTRAGQIRGRLGELRSERDKLMLTYTDKHPDVVRIQHQMSDLEEDLRNEERSASTRSATPSSVSSANATFNPLYGELKSKLAESRRQGAAANARAATAQTLLNGELERSRRIASSESTLAELTRDYEVNRDLYQDLLKRRENARVSMNLDAERRGLSFRVQEPAAMPLRPSGLRLMHVAGAGLAGAFVAPLVLLLGFIKLDPRVRSPLQIEREAGLPVLGSIPMYRTGAKRKAAFRRYALAASLFLLVPIAYGSVLALKLAHAL
jgi:polysaccharide chain length determinant protein (PEP-CTERM system associated)